VKLLKNQSYNYICFELARLRTRYDNEADNGVRVSIAKRYREVVDEFNKRTDNWFWKEHELDRIIKAVEEFEKADLVEFEGHMGKWITVNGKHIFIREEESVNEAIDRKKKEIEEEELKHHGKEKCQRCS